jgi:P27 family predicted phage terminase small subunit
MTTPSPPRRLDPPGHYDDARRATWTDAITRLTDTGGVFRADPALLDAYTEAVAAHRQASSILSQTNVMITRNGQAVENPALGIQRRAADAMAKAARNLGLHRTPMTAGTLQVPPARPDPLGGARWCDVHHRPECIHHRRKCAHQGGPVPPEGCCHQHAVTGTASCYLHAGKSLPEARAEGEANRRRIYTGGMVEIDPATALLQELGHSAALVEELRARVADLAEQDGPDGEPGTGLFWGAVLERDRGDGIIEREHRAGPHAILRALDQERDHLVKTAAAAHTAGAQAAQVDAARAAGAGLYRLLELIFAALELSDRQREELIPERIPAIIRAWNPASETGS